MFVILLSACLGAMAQQPDAAAPNGETAATEEPPANETPPRRVEESQPRVYYLPDKQGHLQPVLDFPYQDFVELYKQRNQIQQRNEPPRFSLQRIDAVGKAGEEYANLDVHFQVLLRSDGWVRIPLRLDQAVLQKVGPYKGSGEQFVHYETEGEEYVWWLKGRADSQHEITLTILVPLTSTGSQPRLRLHAPRAAASELTLTVPVANAVGTVSDDATLLPTRATSDGGTEFQVTGLGGELSLAWHKPDPQHTEASAVLEASCTVLTKLESRSITAEAALSIRSYGAAFEEFVVRLPPEMTLMPANQNDYSLRPLETKPEDASKRQSVAVRLPKKTTGPVEVHLSCRRDYDPEKDQSWCELAGFEVLGAVRQWGVSTVTAPAEWQILWGARSDVRETDRLPDALPKESMAACFEYATQPHSLTARLTPRKTRISVEPKYVVLIDADEARLEGRLSYSIRGAKTATLDIALPGWELDDVGPAELIASDGPTSSADRVAIPLAKAVSGTIELQLRAHRTIDAKTASFHLDLPCPEANSVGLASVFVVPADNIELTLNRHETQGLARQLSISPLDRMALPERQQSPLCYRGTGGAATFAADYRVLARQISVDTATQVSLRGRTAEVEQKQSYFIANEPVDALCIAVPRSLAAMKRIEALCDGKPVRLISSADESRNGDARATVPMRAILPAPRIGDCTLTLKYSVGFTEPTEKKASELAIPLTMPEGVQMLSDTLNVKPSRNIRVALNENGPSAWSVVKEGSPAAEIDKGLQLTAGQPSNQVELRLRWEAEAGTTIVHRAWVQSYLGAERQDRAAYQITTDRKELEVELPSGAAIDETVVFVDGKNVAARKGEGHRLLVPLPGESTENEVVVELLYRFDEPRPPRGAFCLEFPRIGLDSWVRRMYWQLVLPADEHLVANPSGFTGEFVWNWMGYYWGRQPLLDQEALETWVGASTRSLLPERVNTYLFSSLGDPRQAELQTAGRTWIVLAASGAALVMGLLLIYVPVCRHSAALMTLVVALSAVWFIAPEPTLLCAQAAILGLMLAILSGLLERGMSRRHRPIVVKEPSSVRAELGSTHAPFRVASANAPMSTETLPAIQPTSPGNAEP